MAITIEEWRSRAKYFDFDGRQIAYWHEGDGKPLLLIHGFPTASWDWTPVWNTLKRKHTLIAADMIGFGLSDKPKQEYSIHQQADMQLALLRHLGIAAFDALVHDYGASVGQELLARQQDGTGADNLGQMIFLNGGMYPALLQTRPIMRLASSPFGALASKILNRKQFGKSFSQVFGPKTKPSEEQLDIFWALFSNKGGHRMFHRLAHFLHDRNEHEERWVGALESARHRVGLINGGSDPVSGERSYYRWVDGMPEANEHLLSGIGHYPHVEAPAEVASTALQWLSSSKTA